MTTSKESLPDSNSPLEGWVRQVLPKALGFARSLTGDPYLAEDIVQDCLYRLLAKRDRYDLARDGWKILLRAITNAVVDEHRRRGQVVWETMERVAGEGDLSDGGESASQPLDVVLSRELEERIAVSLTNLPVPQRAALELKSFGCSLAEIAETLSISESHAGVLVYRARQTMAKALAEWL
jgi:RNA polymerase sigma factor (sigma-70 family)